MAVWEEKQISKYGKKETARLFQYFQMYRDQTPPRSVGRLHKQLIESSKKSSKKSSKVPQLTTLYVYCKDFNWVERAEAYDQHQIDQYRESKELQWSKVFSDVADFSSDEISDSKDFVKFSKKVITDALNMYNNNEISLKEFNRYVESVTKSYISAVELVHKYDPTLKEKQGSSTINNINQVGDGNHATFHNLMQKKGDVIDEYLQDEDRRRKGKQDTG